MKRMEPVGHDMWRGWYGKEPFDLRLTALRMLYKLPLIIALTLLGMLVFGGGYYVKNVLFAAQPFYTATSTFRVEYAVEEEKDVGTVHINEMSWNTYVHSDLFLDMLRRYLQEAADTGKMGANAQDMETGTGEMGRDAQDMETDTREMSADVREIAAGCVELDSSELAGMLSAVLGSDLRVPAITVTTDSPEKSVLIARAAEAAMTREFAWEIREILSISVIDPGDRAQEVFPDVRVGRAFALSGVLAFFFAVVVLLLKETGDDSIWLPASLWRRYGLKTAGTVESREFAENIKCFFEGDVKRDGICGGQGQASLPVRRIALCTVQEQIDAEAVLERVRQACAGTIDICKEDSKQKGKPIWFAVPSPVYQPENCETLRRADGILLAVQAGSHAGRQLERVLELLTQQGCRITAAVLWAADEKLIRRYYCEGVKGRFSRKKAAEEDGR